MNSAAQQSAFCRSLSLVAMPPASTMTARGVADRLNVRSPPQRWHSNRSYSVSASGSLSRRPCRSCTTSPLAPPTSLTAAALQPSKVANSGSAFNGPTRPRRVKVVASGAAAAAPADANQPPDWMKSVPILRRSPDAVLLRLTVAINCIVILSVFVVAFNSFFTAHEALWSKWVASTERLLKASPSAAWAAYNEATLQQPWTTSMTISGVTYFLADWTAQTVEGRHFLSIDTLRLLRSVLVGAFILGPFAHSYYHLQDHFFHAFVPESWGLWAAPLKILLDQTLYAAAYNVVFYMGLGLFAFKNPIETWVEVKKVFWRLMKAGWKLWPLVHCFTYTVIPTSHKLLWVDTIEVAWVTFLSIVANEKKKHTEEVIRHELEEGPAVEIDAQVIEERSEQLMVEAQVSEMMEMGSMEDLVSALDTKDETKQERVLEEAVLSYSEARKSESSTGGDAKLYMLESIAAEDVVRSEVASVLRQAGLTGKSIEHVDAGDHDTLEAWADHREGSDNGDIPGAVQAEVAEQLKAISDGMFASALTDDDVKEIARATAVAEVAKVTEIIHEEKDDQIEELKEKLVSTRRKLQVIKEQEEQEMAERSDRNWMGP